MPVFREVVGLAGKPVAAAAIENLVQGHEALIAGRRGGARSIARFIVARQLRCDRRRLSDSDLIGAALAGSVRDATAEAFARADDIRVALDLGEAWVTARACPPRRPRPGGPTLKPGGAARLRRSTRRRGSARPRGPEPWSSSGR